MKYSYAIAIFAGALTAIGCAANEEDLGESTAELSAGCVDADDEKPVDNAKDKAAGSDKDSKPVDGKPSDVTKDKAAGADKNSKAPVDAKDKPSNGAKPKPCQNKPGTTKPGTDGKPGTTKPGTDGKPGTDVKDPADKPSPKPAPDGKDVDGDGASAGNIAVHCSNGVCQCASGPNKGKSCEAAKPGASNCKELCTY